MNMTSFSGSIVIRTMQEDSIDLNLSQPSVLKNQLIQAQNTIDQLQQLIRTLQEQIITQQQNLQTMVQSISRIDREIINLFKHSAFNTIKGLKLQLIDEEKIMSPDKTITQIQTNFEQLLKQLEIHFPITPITLQKSRTIKRIELVKPPNSGQKKTEKMTDQLTESFYKGHKFSKTEPNQFFTKKN